MAIGTTNRFEERIVDIYIDKQTVNFDAAQRVSPSVVMDCMTMIAVNNQAFLNIRRKAS